jgi:hypothetical protein
VVYGTGETKGESWAWSNREPQPSRCRPGRRPSCARGDGSTRPTCWRVYLGLELVKRNGECLGKGRIMYYLVHIIMILFGFSVGSGVWLSLCAHAHAQEGEPYFWFVGGLIGLGIGWKLAGILVKNAPKSPSQPSPSGNVFSERNTTPKPYLSCCPDCGHDISVRAPSCPHCGCPFRRDPGAPPPEKVGK